MRSLPGDNAMSSPAAATKVVSIAWLPLASLDRWADARLSEASPLRDSVVVAAAQAIYLDVNRRFSGPRWRWLAAKGARPAERRLPRPSDEGIRRGRTSNGL
jgi:hypothetical protein